MQDVAFLIKVHNFPDLLGRLASRLDRPWARTFIHVDAKADANTFTAAVKGISNCEFIPDTDRISVHWGGFSIAQTTLLLGRTALAAMPDVRRLFVLSGQDYPLRPLDLMRSEWLGPSEFVRAGRQLSQSGKTHNDMFIRHRYFGNRRLLNERNASWPALAKLAKKLARMLPAPVPPVDIAIYHGSDWYGLTEEAMRHILDFYDQRPDLIRFFRTVRSPTEMIVQTALKAGPFAERIRDAGEVHDGPERRHVRGSHFIDWSAGGSHPKTLTLEDLPRLRSTDAFFGRKMDPLKSATLLDRLDAEDC